MKIIWLGHASFKIEIAQQVLLIDPWLTGNPILPEEKHAEAIQGATHILLTHAHFDHICDTLPIAKDKNIPIVGQVDLISHWVKTEAIEGIGFNKGGTVMLGDVAVTEGDGEKQNHSWHVTEDSCVVGLLGNVCVMISVLVQRYGPFSNCSSNRRSPAEPLSRSAVSPPRAKRATAPKRCRKRSALPASNGTVAPPLI